MAREDPRGPEIIRHHPRLDPAMIRPGRVDVIHEVGDATPHQMRTLYLNFFPDQPQLADAFADALSGSSVSMARRCSPGPLLALARHCCYSRRSFFLLGAATVVPARLAPLGGAGVRGRGRAGYRGGAGEGRARDAAAAAAEGGKGRVVPGRCGPVGGGWPCQCAHRRLGVRGGDGRGLEL